MKTNYTLIGDVREKLKELPDKSIQMCVTSPPYYNLRNYENQENQLGLEKTPEEFVENMVQVFSEVHRVLRDDGTLWLNLGDSYLKDKQLGFIPQKVAIALQEWGWVLRQDIIWAKKNCMPESAKDRFTKNHEYIFLLSKQPKYFFNQILEPVKQVSIERAKSPMKHRTISTKGVKYDLSDNPNRVVRADGMKNKRSVWNMRTAAYKEAHFAVFPPELAETCIKAGSDDGDIVLDCFMGSGTTAMVAQRHSRKWIGVELNPEYEKLIRKRTAQRELF